MSRLVSMTLANVKMTYRARQALFWNLALPLILMGLLGLVLSNSSFGATISVVGKGPVATLVTDSLHSINGITIKTGSESDERAALKKGDRDAVVIVPDAPAAPGQPLQITLYYDQTNLSRSDATVSLVSQVVQGVNERLVERKTHASPQIVLHQEGIAAVSTRYIDFLAPGVLGFSIMTSGVIGIASRMVGYREKRILKRLRATPMKAWEFILSNVISQLVVVLAQVAVLLLAATLLFGVHVQGSMISVVLLSLLGGLAFLTIGFAISGLAATEEAASAIGNLITMPMMFLSGVYFPLTGAPGWLKPVVNVLPLTYLVSGLRDVMEKGLSISAVGVDFAVLGVTSLVGFAFAARMFRWDSTN
jgi:ABC-2 type transport system permease protein